MFVKYFWLEKMDVVKLLRTLSAWTRDTSYTAVLHPKKMR